MIEVKHECDERGCRIDAEECYCNSHLEEKLKEAYDEGYQDAVSELKDKN